MIRKAMVMLIAILGAVSVHGDNFPNNFQLAMRLYQDGQFVQAEEAFIELSGQRVAQLGIDASLTYAAYCANQRQEYKKASEYAARIKNPHRRTLCQLQLLQTQNDWNAILALSRDEKFESWPDDLIYPALMCRADAWLRSGDTESAIRDFRAAANYTVVTRNLATIYLLIGNAYRDNLKDEQKAMDAYGEVVRIMSDPKPSMSGGKLVQASMARAELLAARGDGKAALAELDRLKVLEPLEPRWTCTIQLCYGDTYKTMNNVAEALKHYRVAAAVEGAPASLLESANQKITAMKSTTQNNEETK